MKIPNRWARPNWTPPIFGWQYRIYWNEEVKRVGNKVVSRVWTARSIVPFEAHAWPLSIECVMHPEHHCYWTLSMKLGETIHIFVATGPRLDLAILSFEYMVRTTEKTFAQLRREPRKPRETAGITMMKRKRTS